MDPIDYEKVLEDLEGRRTAFNAAVDAAIGSIKTILAMAKGGPIAAASPDVHAPTGRLTPEMLFGKSIPEAAVTCLQTFKTPMAAKEIAEALEQAKYHHRSQNFVNTVNSVLNRREAAAGDVVKVGRSWALSDWYPGRRRVASRGGAGSEIQHGASVDEITVAATDETD